MSIVRSRINCDSWLIGNSVKSFSPKSFSTTFNFPSPFLRSIMFVWLEARLVPGLPVRDFAADRLKTHKSQGFLFYKSQIKCVIPDMSHSLPRCLILTDFSGATPPQQQDRERGGQWPLRISRTVLHSTALYTTVLPSQMPTRPRWVPDTAQWQIKLYSTSFLEDQV